MKPKKSPQRSWQKDLLRPELTKIIHSGHGLVKLSKTVNWGRMDELFGDTYCPDNRRPGVITRLMVSLHHLKYTHNLSDEEVVSAWVENPCRPYLSGMKYFENELPIHPSSLTRWRSRIGDAGANCPAKPLCSCETDETI